MHVKECSRCGIIFKDDNELLLEIQNKSKYNLCLRCKEKFYNFLNKYKEVMINEKE